MLALNQPDAFLGGLLAYYSIIHIPWDLRPQLLAEFYRVLAPGAPLMLTFQIGPEHNHRRDFLGTPIDISWYRQQPGELTNLLGDAGFSLWASAVREAEGTETCPQGYILARKA